MCRYFSPPFEMVFRLDNIHVTSADTFSVVWRKKSRRNINRRTKNKRWCSCVCAPRSNMIMPAMLSLTSPRSQLIRHSAHDGRPRVEMRKGRLSGLICFLSLALSSSSPAKREREREEYISDRLPSFFLTPRLFSFSHLLFHFY